MVTSLLKSLAVLALMGTLLVVLPKQSALLAQTGGTGALTVNITDSTGAVVAGAQITVTAPTGVTRTEQTSGTGGYTFSLLRPGSYKVDISAQGFTPVAITNVQIDVAETHVLNQPLEVTSQKQQVTVEANIQQVQTETTALGDVVGGRSINELPLSTRNFTQIMALSTGMNAAVTNAGSLGMAFATFFANGQADTANTYSIDGAVVNNVGFSSTDSGGVGGHLPTPSPDAIQEFKVQTTLYDASYGRNAGANVTVITKTGTNNFHGTAFEYFRNSVLNANDFFLNRSGHARGVLDQNQFGGAVGGPIKKDKLFFFLSYEGTRQRNGVAAQGSATVTVPAQLTNNRSAAALGSAFCPANNPVLNTNTFAGGTQVACDGSNINPVALAFLNYKVPAAMGGGYVIPTPQTVLNAGTAAAVGVSTFSLPATWKENQGLAAVDYLISPKETLAAKAYYAISPQETFLTAGEPPGSGDQALQGANIESLKLTSLLTPSLINEARASVVYNRISNYTTDPVVPLQIGMSAINPAFQVMPQVVVNATGLTLGGSSTDGTRGPDRIWGESDQVSWTHGRHTIRFGGDYQHVLWSFFEPGIQRGDLVFQTFSDLLLGESAAQNGSPLGYSNLLSSAAVRVANGSVTLVRENLGSVFIQDDYKLSSRLTFNLGLRWEYNGSGYDANTTNGGASYNWAVASALPIPPASGTYVGWTVGLNNDATAPVGVLRRPTNTISGTAPLDAFSPRVGFAYQPFGSTGKLVLRGGFGTFFQNTQGETYVVPFNNNPPNDVRVGLAGSANGAATWANPYNPAPVLGWTSALRTPTSGIAIGAVDPLYRPPVTLTWNFNVQYALTQSLALEVGYVGTRGEHLLAGVDLNSPQIANPSNPLNCGAPFGCITTNTSANAAQRVPVLGITPNGVAIGTNAGDSEYDALQVTLRKRFTHGLQFQGSYTYAGCWTDLTGASFAGVFSGTLLSNDPTNWAQQHGPCEFQRRQRLVVNYSYLLPSYKGGQGALGYVLSGWGISGVTVVQDGQKMTPIDSTGGQIQGLTATSFAGTTTARAEICPGFTYGQAATSGTATSRLNDWFNLNAFADTTATKGSASCAYPIIGMVNGVGGASGYGNAGRGIVTGPGQFNWDIAFTKLFKVTEAASLQFRGELFNAFNHPQFNNPALTVNSPSFGVITGASVAPRIIQLALRFAF